LRFRNPEENHVKIDLDQFFGTSDMNAEQFMNELEREVLAHPVLHDPCVTRIAGLEVFPREQAKRFGLAYYPHILHTRLYQANALGMAADEGVQFALAGILHDEYGNGDPARTHMAVYRKFLRAVGASAEEIAAGGTVIEELRLYIDAMMAYTRGGDWLAAAAAVGIAMEWPIPYLYGEFLKGLRRIPEITEDDLELFVSHVGLDVEHSAQMRDALLPFAATAEGQARIRAGVRYNMDARRVFMRGLRREVFGHG
jgi:pyrroloquinoline-quinone synthase